MSQYLPLRPARPFTVSELYTVHYFEYAAGYAFQGEKHDFWELLYVDRGLLRVTAGERVRELSQGQLIFHAPGEFHALSAVGVPPDLIVVSFGCGGGEMERFRGLVTDVSRTERSLLARIVAESGGAFSTPLDDPSTTTLHRAQGAPFGAESLVCAALEELLIRLARRMSVDEAAPDSFAADADGFERTAEYLERHVGESLSLEQICRDNYLGRSQLQKIFHEHTGGGVMEYFGRLKINAARRMIRTGRYNFTQIAALCGFQSVHYFSRRFRQLTGMSPSEYAQSVRMLLEFPGGSPDDSANNL